MCVIIGKVLDPMGLFLGWYTSSWSPMYIVS